MDSTPEAPQRPKRDSPLRRILVLGLVAVVAIGAVAAYVLTQPTPWKRAGAPITVSGWAPYWQTDSATASFSANARLFSDVSLFAFHATAADAVSAYDGLDPNASAQLRSIATTAHAKLTASIIDDTAPKAMAAILADPATRATHVRTIVQLAVANGFDGIDLDYENFAFNDGKDTWATTRPNWVAFVTELAAALHGQGKTVSVSIPPIYDSGQNGDSGYWVYDAHSIGRVVDKVRIMAYDYSTGEAGPIAPIGWVTSVVKAFKKLVPSGKLVLGVPVYGYDWPSNVSGACPADQEPKRHHVSTKSAAVLVAAKGALTRWDATAAERTFTYTEQLLGTNASGAPTTCSVDHTVWYSDAQSVHDLAWLAERQDLAGIALWSMGGDDELTWQGIAAARADVAVWPAVPVDAATTTAPPTSAAATSAAATTAPATTMPATTGPTVLP